MSKITTEQVMAAVEEHGSINKAAESLGIARSTAQKYARLGKNKVKLGKDTAVVEGPFSSPEEALLFAGLSPDAWEVERTVANSWDVTGKIDGEWDTQTNFQVKYTFRRIVPDWLEQAVEFIDKRLGKAPKRPKVKHGKIKDPHMGIMSLYDAHFGKLCWAMETGENYDIKVAETVYLKAVRDLLAKAQSFPLDKIVFPIGQDFYNIDNLASQTTAGTPQDADSRLFKIFKAGEYAVEQAIDLCREVAPVEVLYVPGNHDRHASWYLCNTLSAVYRKTPDVVVDVTPTTNKYVEYGKNLIGFVHGDGMKGDKLPTLMADQAPHAWARTDGGTREYHTGHLHVKREVRYIHTDTHGGTVVRIIPSLSGTDAWHYWKGYVKGLKAAELHLYSKSAGRVGEFVHSADEGDYR